LPKQRDKLIYQTNERNNISNKARFQSTPMTQQVLLAGLPFEPQAVRSSSLNGQVVIIIEHQASQCRRANCRTVNIN